MTEAKSDSADWLHFENLPTTQVAAMLSANRRRSVVIAITGTQRWFVLDRNNGVVPHEAYWDEYRQAIGEQFVALLRLLFEHGIHTIFMPLLANKARGRVYLDRVLRYLPCLFTDQALRQLYEDFQVQARLYGPYRSVLESLGLEKAREEMISETTRQPFDTDSRRVFWGLLTPESDPDMEIAVCAVEHYRRTGAIPTREQLIETLYGNQIEPIDFLLTGGKFQVLNYLPPLLRGKEDLYFTVTSPLGITQRQLRSILFDKLYCRKTVTGNRHYQGFSPQTLLEMKSFLDLNRESVVGVGRYHPEGRFWYPIPQLGLPDALEREEQNAQ